MSRVWQIRYQMARLAVFLGCTILLLSKQFAAPQEGRTALRSQPVATINSSPEQPLLLHSDHSRPDSVRAIKHRGPSLLQSSGKRPVVSIETLAPTGYTSFWSRYYQYISGGVLVALAEAALIILLLVQWSRRKRAQATLERRFAVERVITELSTSLVDCIPQRLKAEIEIGLRKLVDA